MKAKLIPDPRTKVPFNIALGMAQPATLRVAFHQCRPASNRLQHAKWLLRLFILLFVTASCYAQLVLTYDSRELEVARGQSKLAPTDGSRWDYSMNEPFISAGSGEEIARQVASQSSLFSPSRVEGIGNATTTYTPGHASCGAKAGSNLEFRFTVTQAVSFRFSASCHGGKVNDNLSFTGPLPLGQIVHIHKDEQASASGTLVPGKYILRASCQTQANDSWQNGGWQFELNIGTPPAIKVVPSPLDFGKLGTREEKTLYLAIGNYGPADSVLSGRIYQPASLAFTVVDAPMDFTLRPGQSLELQVRVRAPINHVPDDEPIVGSIPIHSSDPSNPVLYVPLVAVMKAPMTITTPGISRGNFLIEFPSELGRTYTVERCTNLAGDGWTSITNLAGSGGLVSIPVPVNTFPAAFFRVRTQ